MLGTIHWRGLELPLVSFEALAGGAPSAPAQGGRIAVVNRVNDSEPAFYAILTAGIPRLLRLGEDELAGDEDATAPEGVTPVRVEGAPAWIPDLESLQSMIAGHWRSAA